MRNPQDRFVVRKRRVRAAISRNSDRLRLSVCKSARHVYAQVIDMATGETLVAASTLESGIRILNKSLCNVGMASVIGDLVGQRAVAKGIKTVVFDKGGYKYHGVVKELANAARKYLEF